MVPLKSVVTMIINGNEYTQIHFAKQKMYRLGDVVCLPNWWNNLG